MSVLPNSTFLDLTSWHGVPAGTSIASAYNITSTFTPGGSINVALILPRAEDPTALLQSDWATRQKTLADLNAQGTLWQHYGANQQDYDSLVAQMQATAGVTLLGQGNDGYVSSVESRTLWVKVDASAFNTVFGTPLLGANAPGGNFEFWNGNLNAPGAVSEVFFDYGWDPAIQGQSTNPYSPGFGPQSIGNSATSPASLYPQQVAALYNFPLNGSVGVTGTLGLIEPGVGTALPAGTTASFGALLGAYLAQATVAGSPNAYSVANGGQTYNSSSGGERSLDIGVVAAINPNASFALYAGSGSASGAHSTTFTAYQSAFWDTINNPEVISSSFWDNRWSAPGSPFFGAYQDLFVDAALRNISVFMAAGDGGSGSQWATGLNNLGYANSSPWTVQVGGSSLTLMQSAASDSTVVNAILTPAQAQDPAVIWGLMQSGLKTMPSALPPASPLLESAWNAYTINHDKAFVGSSLTNDFSGAGGVDTRLAVPDYQSKFGLTPTNSDSTGGTGRGMPDVTALAGGDTFWIAPIQTMATTSDFWHGTSAAAPMWASLALQVDAVFHDQGLPPLGYAIDLLYIAAVIAPGSFNDILQGNNVSTFTSGSGAYINGGIAVSPTGFGYFAGPGYDLTSGLGSPDGLLLARALTAIADHQMHFDSSPPLLDQDGGGWTSGADQSLLFQTMANSPVTVGIGIGTGFVGYTSSMPSGYAWTSRLAEQSLQADFDPNLVRLFDKQGQGALFETDVHKGLGLGVAIDQQLGSAIQASLSNPFGFADFFTNDGAVRVARAVAVAETVGGLNDQTAIVRIRQGGTDSLSVSFYKVDDFSGKIGDLHAGDAGYMQAALTRAYQLGGGGISMGGPGYGNFQQGSLQGVNAGDKVAMFLSDNTTGITYWAFSQGNETFAGQKVGHLWNYGLNTWGWEDQYGGGDHDYNDLMVQLDFTSAYGHGWLVHG